MSSCSRYGLFCHSEDSDPVGGMGPGADDSWGPGERARLLSVGTLLDA